MRRRRTITEKPALDMVEDAVALLRRCPPQVALLYYTGAAPFILGVLYFWTDMSRGAFAGDRLVESSLLVAAGYLWCKCWQSFFAAQLMALACQRPLPRWTWQKLGRIVMAQAAIQPAGLFVRPLAALITLPLGVACAFYHNATVLVLDGMGEPLDGAALRREALAQARRWTAQNLTGLAVLSFFGLAVFANVLIVMLAMPWMLKTLFGMETMFTRSLFSMFNTTVFASAAGITYLCVDPIFKAFYVLRCFNGRSLSTGEDIQVELRSSQGRRLAAAAVMLLFFCAGLAHGAEAASGTPGHGTAARSAQIDDAVSDVLSRPEFAWRSPREVATVEQKSRVENFLDGVGRMVRKWLKPVKRLGSKFFRWLGKRMTHQMDYQSSTSGGERWLPSLRFFAWLFCAVAACVLAVTGWRLWRRRITPAHIIAAPSRAVPDLEAESLTADQLPEEGWLRLAREMIEQGDLRLALRALYLAALAHLGEREAISIARYKSNREYERELLRRRPAQTDLIAAFASTVGAFERAWYGMHEVTREIIDASQTNLEKIRQGA